MKLFKQIFCIAMVVVFSLVLVACNRVQAQPPEELNLDVWDGVSVTSVDDLAAKVVKGSMDSNGHYYNTLKVSTVADFAAAMRDINNYENFTIELENDLHMNNKIWSSATIDGESKYVNVTIDGNGHVVYNLTNMLISTANYNFAITFKNLTITDSLISVDFDDVSEETGVGAFIGRAKGVQYITLDNCHINNSKVEGGHWTGALIGHTAGSTVPGNCVFTDVLVDNCSVKCSVITGKGSCGSIVGHASGNDWIKFIIQKCNIVNNDVLSVGTSNIKAGVVLGTVGAAGQEKTRDGVTKTGGIYVNNVVVTNDNNAVSNGVRNDSYIFGRQGETTAVLYVDGVSVEFPSNRIRY